MLARWFYDSQPLDHLPLQSDDPDDMIHEISKLIQHEVASVQHYLSSWRATGTLEKKMPENVVRAMQESVRNVIYPWPETLQYGQKYFNWENFGFELSKKYNFTLINMFPVFNKIKDKNKYWYNKLYFMRDEHFNKNGHKIIGNYLTKHLL